MFEVGDKVISITFGYGVITSIDDDVEYPINVKFEDHTEEENFTTCGRYHKYNEYEHPNNIKKANTTSEATNYKKTKVIGFGTLLEFDNGVCIYHPIKGKPFEVHPTKLSHQGLQ